MLQTSNLLPVQVIKLSHEDIWFKSRTTAGSLTCVEGIQSTKTGEVQFQIISADTGEVSIDRHKGKTTTVQSILDQLNVGGNQELQKLLASLVAKYLVQSTT